MTHQVFLAPVLLGLTLLAACNPLAEDERPTVTYTSVAVKPQKAHVRGTSIAVEIELDVTSRMPHVAPHVTVAAQCDGQHDKGDAFFMDLSRAQPGDHEIDTIELFGVSSFDAAPTRCEVTLSLSKGATPPARYCFENGATHAGRCS